MIGSQDEISLYFHIPFCTRKCGYCHFYVLPDEEAAKDRLAVGFSLELALLQPYLENKKISTLYFGGGTPSLFGAARLFELINLIRKTCTLQPHAEITLEANPENAKKEQMKNFADAGINRISIGIQTLEPELLQLLGRVHTNDTALRAVEAAYEGGIGNISVDLMYDLPSQTLGSWKKTLEALEPLPLSHLSLYNLTIEPHTLFFKNQDKLRPLLPDQNTSLAMYETAIERLEQRGLMRYEISAFAKPGCESRHNTGYWTGRNFLGLGPSAYSYWEGKRYRNIANLKSYCQSLKEMRLPIDFEEQLDEDARRRELFVIRLRLKEGLHWKKFYQDFGPLDCEAQNTLSRLIKEDYLEEYQGQIRLTHKGVLFYDSVAVELI